jgi:hypothetical protein
LLYPCDAKTRNLRGQETEDVREALERFAQSPKKYIYTHDFMGTRELLK